MRFNIPIFILVLASAILLAGCGGAETPTNGGNRNVANTNSNAGAANSNNPLGTTKTPEAATSNSAPTLSPVVQGYYDALRRKDEAGVRKFLSQSALKYWQNEMKTEKKNSLLAILEDSEAPVGDKREVRNETIQGDNGYAEIRGGSLGVWTRIKFVRENGEWKFASPEESFKELEGISKPPANAV
jgi:hypothetical protein